MAWDDCGGKRRRGRTVHTRLVYAVMAVHTVYQSNAYRIDFNICVGNREEERKRRGEEKKNRKIEKEDRNRRRGSFHASLKHLWLMYFCRVSASCAY